MNTDRGAAAAHEVDLASGWRAVGQLWWLVLLVAAAVVALALLNAGTAPNRYEANATVYIGQPIAPNGALLNTVSAKATTAIEIATGDAALRKAADAAGGGMTPSAVRGELSVVAVQSPIASKLLNPPTLLKVIARDKRPAVATAIATAVANELVVQTNTYAVDKTKSLEARAAALQLSVDDLNASRDKALANAGKGGNDAVWTALLATVSSDLRNTQADLLDAQSQLQVSKEIELSKVVARPAARRVTVATRRPTVVVALFVGLGIGVVVALLVGALRRRRPGHSA